MITDIDREAADKAFDVAFRGDTDGIDDAMAELFARHRIATIEQAARIADRHDTGDCTREDMEARRIAAEIRALAKWGDA